MKLDPFVQVDDTLFSVSRNELVRRRGPPLRRSVNDVALEAFDYGGVGYRFQASGRLEEVTQRAPVLHLGELAVPFRALQAFVRAQDADAFERAGYPVVLHVYDEIVSEIPEGWGSIEEFERIVTTPPEWAREWPIKAPGGWRAKRYRKG